MQKTYLLLPPLAGLLLATTPAPGPDQWRGSPRAHGYRQPGAATLPLPDDLATGVYLVRTGRPPCA